MASLKVDTGAIKDKAASFKTVSKSIKGFTSEMTNEINGLKSTWKGNAGETLVKKFNGLTDNFEDICKTINEYADFLENAADSYENVENSAVQGAESQQS